jgi:hypothetical protein
MGIGHSVANLWRHGVDTTPTHKLSAKERAGGRTCATMRPVATIFRTGAAEGGRVGLEVHGVAFGGLYFF